MSASTELNMEAFFDTRDVASDFDEDQESDYDEQAVSQAFFPNETFEEETEENDIDEDLVSAPALPITRAASGPHAFDDHEILFRDLVRDHQKRLYRFVIRYIDHPDDAADITQQAFVEAARTISSFRGDSKLSTWLYGIAMNMVRNYMRKLIEQDLYELPVLSYQELTQEVNIQPLARVEI
jgi:hypothetical protein